MYSSFITQRKRGHRSAPSSLRCLGYVLPWYDVQGVTLSIRSQRIDRIKSTLTSDLEHHFAITLLALTSAEKSKLEKAKQPEAERAKLISDLTDCLRAYDMLGLWRDAEDVIRRELVREFAKKVVTTILDARFVLLILLHSIRRYTRAVYLAPTLLSYHIPHFPTHRSTAHLRQPRFIHERHTHPSQLFPLSRTPSSQQSLI